MVGTALSPIAQLQSLLAQIDQSSEHHDRWFESVVRCVACREPADPRNLAADAHRLCAFGYWDYNLAPDTVRKNAGFVALGEIHERMHRAAAVILMPLDAGAAVSTEQFDEFAGCLKRFRLQLTTLRREFEQSVSGVDPLTGAGNRVVMLPHLRQQHALVQRGVARCVVAMMDLDRFKAVNDTHGHAAGDRVLAAFAAYVLANLRPYDRLFRYGGEEFLLCALDADLKLGFALAERMREGVAALKIDAGLPAPLGITVSIGVAALEAGSSVERAIELADKAVYSAKAAGRNRTVIVGA
jgi:diguanylate cyclase (GGDEF)-like protein